MFVKTSFLKHVCGGVYPIHFVSIKPDSITNVFLNVCFGGSSGWSLFLVKQFNIRQYVLSKYVYSSDVKLTAFWFAILRKVL